MAAITRPLVLAIALLGLLALAGPALLRNAPALKERIVPVSGGASEQSSSQISPGEFEQLLTGMTPEQLRAYAGAPAAKSSAEVEGIALECWYYGAVGTTGAYQLCFKNGRLTSKQSFDRG